MNITEDQLKQYVDNVFKKYDSNGNYVLEEDELYLFFKDLFVSLGQKHSFTMQDVRYSLKQIDANHDGKITKTQLFNALKLILKINKPSTGNKQTNLPYQQNKQHKNHKEQEPPRQKTKQQMYRQQQKLQQQNNKPNTGNKHHDNSAQKNPQHQQQKKLTQQQKQQLAYQQQMNLMNLQNPIMDPYYVMMPGGGRGYPGMLGGMPGGIPRGMPGGMPPYGMGGFGF